MRARRRAPAPDLHGPRSQPRRPRRRLRLRRRVGPGLGPPGALERVGSDRLRRPRPRGDPRPRPRWSTSTCTRRPSGPWRRSRWPWCSSPTPPGSTSRQLRADLALPVRLLGIGLPLTIGAGAALAAGLFSGAGLWVAAAIGAIVAPTDAALGASIMEDERVPAGVRRVLNVESGLNDGIATPFVNFFLAGAATAEAVHGASSAATAVLDLLGGAAIGVGVGLVGAVLLAQARKHHWSAPGFRPLAVLALALFAYSSSVLAGTNGFVAAFVAGMAFGTVFPRHDDELLEFSAGVGHAHVAAGLVPVRRRHARPGPRGRHLAGRDLRRPGTHRGAHGPGRASRSPAAASTGPPSPSSAGSDPAAWPASSSASSPSTRSPRPTPRSSWPP